MGDQNIQENEGTNEKTTIHDEQKKVGKVEKDLLLQTRQTKDSDWHLCSFQTVFKNGNRWYDSVLKSTIVHLYRNI